MQQTLQQLLQRPELWRAGHLSAAQPGVSASTGFAPLDQLLQGGGWPGPGLQELLCQGPCPQVLRLMLPTLAAAKEGLVVLAGPPARPHARTLTRAGVDPTRLLVLHSEDPDLLLRACREAASSEAVATLLAWMPSSREEQPKTLRRLHLAARQGRCRLFLVRDARHAPQPSPAPLRLVLTPRLPGDLEIRIHKQPGARAGQHVTLPILPELLRTPIAPVTELQAPQQVWRDRQPPSMPLVKGIAQWPQPTSTSPRERPG